MSRVSIIIRAFNEERHIGRLLDGIARQKLPSGCSIETILVDSGSTDSTVPIAKSMGARIHHISQGEFSFGRALNVGCQNALGEFLLFASAHVYPVYTDWIERMIFPFGDNKVALVYGRQIGNEITRFSEHQVFAQWFPLQSNYDQVTPFCNNANCAIRRSLWLEQTFDESLTGLEDLDWAKRIKVRNYKIAYEAGAPIVHVHEETPLKIKSRYQREAIALRRIEPHVHFNAWDFIRLFTRNSFSDYLEALKQRVFFRELTNIAQFRFMQFYGTYLGHNQAGEVSRELKTRFYYPGVSQKGVAPTQHGDRQSKKIEYS